MPDARRVSVCLVCKKQITDHTQAWSFVTDTGDVKYWHITCPDPVLGKRKRIRRKK